MIELYKVSKIIDAITKPFYCHAQYSEQKKTLAWNSKIKTHIIN